MIRLTSSKDLSQLIKRAKKQGWEVVLSNGSHLKWYSPNGKFFFSGSTPSDHRALSNVRRDLRNNGFIEIDRRKKSN